jgi:REP element-mobilizing transposase RayT
MNRGNTGMNIYRSKRDREKFLEYVGEAVKRYGIKVHTYCLMTTHYHFLIETPHPNLSQAIKWINVGYSVYFKGFEQQGDPPTENPETPPDAR